MGIQASATVDAGFIQQKARAGGVGLVPLSHLVHEDAQAMDLSDVERPPELQINALIICFFTISIVSFKKRRSNKPFQDRIVARPERFSHEFSLFIVG